ncbi:PAS domain S-box-containing protein [Rhodoblastus acidophilus]|uniref:sensor histidine kinase n=1 Tax=Rhodoblastus acidophilus TaxID=1074 RepID=UPI0022247DD9|nr:PAS domain S-box protein [Rhodoblastus acidophilus]MCW2282521.1 PAS domain S-box-containing protein [Rhodoblastus acidophilus]MCW2331382.1 PAS domain S-box-containing protein [Rhodoblastus acidophilus]
MNAQFQLVEQLVKVTPPGGAVPALIRWRGAVPTWLCILAGLALAALAFAARIALFGDSAKIPYATFYPLVSFAALCGPPALGATAALAAALVVAQFVAPLRGADDVTALALFALNSALTVGLAEALVRVWSDRIARMARAHAVEQLKAAIVESSDDAIITKTLDGRITSWNPAAARIFGYEAKDMLGQPVTRLFPPELIEEESAILAHLRASGGAAHYRTRRIARDGRTLDVAITISPLRDESGRLVGASKILRDITAEKQRDDELRASEARLRFALEGARAGAWSWDCAAMTSTWEQHFFALHGLDPAEHPPCFDTWLAAVVEEDRAQAEQAVRAALAPGAPDYHSEYRVRVPGGGVRWMEIFGRVERDERGAPLRVSGISLDVSERHTAWEAVEASNRDLQRANDSLKKFSYIAAHDLQEPLRKIQQFSELLVLDCGEEISVEAAYYLKVLSESAERSRVLINNLLDFSRAANRELKTACIDMDALMARVLQTCAIAVAEAGAHVRIAPLPPLCGDEALVEQLFLNLLTNALKYRRPGVAPEIVMTATQDEGRPVYRFSDNGLGIDAGEQARVFEPFVRLREAEGIKGAGIGLAICRTICDRHGWDIALRSELGAGATFTIAAPAAESRQAA